MSASLPKRLPHLIRLAVLGPALGLIAACQPAAEQHSQAAPARVSVAAVVSQTVIEWDEFSARLEAPHAIEIRPRVSGYIDAVAFTEGARVRKGDLLFQIDPRPFTAEVKRLEAQQTQARAAYKRAQNEAQRGAQLRQRQMMSTEQAEARQSSAEEAAAALAAISAQLDNARLNLEFTRISAPIDGRVGRAMITAGNLVSAGDSLLTNLVSTDQVYAYFDVNEQAYLKYQDIAQARGTDVHDSSPVLMALSDEAEFSHHGQLDFLDNQINPNTGTLRARALFANPDEQFTPGLYARIKLRGSAPYAAQLISENAIGTDLGRKYVLVLNADNQVDYRGVTLGPRIAGLRIVRDGLKAGERIVVNGLQRAFPGSTVTPEDVPMADAKTLTALEQLHDRDSQNDAPRVVQRPAARSPQS
ncbi:efflux RND transporter periplasmic adaptor subunit [Atopomonas sediminilitoris]|uniref:efflux RND transporter periplasmic adaptor subunit n=1 Tax=Atopomonas sediminilitoris TaxID=2919919 RepID=UPI001F4E68A1|nr:efflux RND transporter periplasmic adaptor subunit [Atopomonas sediminilitoris]MCJ8167872.1 efflux RND transporter periplasmic adaptor subunit [Atopomonas sediminilitoris]